MRSPTRPAAVAGQFYPAEALRLDHQVRRLLAEAGGAQSPPPKALIVPHAGIVYSGRVAASAYQQLTPLADRIERVVLVGPSHRVAFQGLALPDCEAFDTPLGPVPLDGAAVARLADLPQVGVLDAAHRQEHSLEVQLPFLQTVLQDFRLVPLVAGDARTDEVAEVLERLWGGPETLLVISSDLSHYHDYGTARRLDEETTRAIEALEPGPLDGEAACGCVGVRGLLVAARRHGLRCRTLDLRSSGDTAGPRDRVVGYGAYAFA